MSEYGISTTLYEHEGSGSNYPKEKQPEFYNPTSEEESRIKHVNKLLDRAKKHRSKYDEKWNEWYRFFRGKQWNQQRPSYRHSEVINLVFSAIQASVPIMMDARPIIQYIPEDPTDRDFSEFLNKVVEYDWEKYNWSETLLEVLYDGHITGAGISYIGYDPEAAHGAGAVLLESKDPWYVFPDPAARDCNKKARYFIIAEPTDVDEIKHQWPNKASFIRPDLVDLAASNKTDLYTQKLRSTIDSRLILDGGPQIDFKEDNRALLITCYEKSDDYEESKLDDGNFQQKLKYPRGRKTVICGNMILEDGHIEFEDGKFPFARFTNYIIQREFWGISEIEQVEGPQKIFNKLVSYALDVLVLMGNPIWKVPTTCNIDGTNLFNRPGLIVEYDGPNPPTREEGVQLQPYVFQLIDRLKGWFDEIAGTNEVMRGYAPQSVTANSAIETLLGTAQMRIKQKMRNMDNFLKENGRMYSSRVMQYYSAPRIFRITNKQGADQYFKFHVEQTPDGKKGVVQVIENGIPGPVQEYQIRGEFDVRTTTSSQLPFSKANEETKYLNLFDRGIVDAEAVLNAYDLPNKELILERLQARQDMQQQQGQPAATAQA